MHLYGIARAPATVPPELSTLLTAIDHDGLTAFVSRTGNPLDDPAAFMDVICALAEHQTMIPAQASAEPLTETKVTRLLRSGTQRFNRLLDKFNACSEWSIRITEPTLVATHSISSADDSGRSYLDSRRTSLAMQTDIREDLIPTATAWAKQLAPIATDVRTVPSADAASVAVLIRDADAHRLQDLVASSTLPGTLIGPWPPFSFVGLEA
ncbi:MAG: GvpL/GvpF family gas vesicle protein [Planctomycetota bacterium]